MKRPWKPIAGGILCIIVGAVVAGYGGRTFVSLVGSPITSDEGWLAVILIFFAIPLIMLGVLAIVGGIHALRRRRWRLALVGSISTLACGIIANSIVPFWSDDWLSPVSFSSFFSVLSSVVFGLFGVLALIFVILGKREFK